MKRKDLLVTLSMPFVVGLLCPILTSCNKTPTPYEELINSLVSEANLRIKNVKKPIYRKVSVPGSAIKNYPETFDLRKVDTNGDGIDENYVTGVKFQNPFGSCWSFGSIAAAETSILFDLKQDSVRIDEDGNPRDSLDLSEHHLAWFDYSPLPETDEQAGEGLYSMVEGVSENPSLRLSSGSTQFAAAKVFASGMGPLKEPDFSTAQSPNSQLNYHGKNYDISYTSKGYPIYAKTDDWSIDEDFRFQQSYMLEDAYLLPSTCYIENGVYDYDYADLISKTYKQEIMNGRAICIGFQADSYSPDAVGRAAKYINTKTYAHYCYEPVLPNHSVTIIGWDDNYSKTNFLSEIQKVVDGVPQYDDDGNPIMIPVNQPAKDGAWIVKNSWGALDTISDGLCFNEWGVNATGYFYLSYYDQSIAQSQCFDFDVTNRLSEDLEEYSLEEYDLMPTEETHNIVSKLPIASGNAFKAKQHEIIKDIGCDSNDLNEEITFSIYEKVDGKFDTKHPLSEFTLNFVYAGYHVINLPEPIELDEGDEIIICLTQKCGGEYFLGMNSEFNKKAYDNKYCSDEYYAKGVVNPGESYIILSNGEIVDLADIKTKLENMSGNTSYLTYDNFPIKAYASLK